MYHHRLLDTEVEDITAALEHLEVEGSLADLDIPEAQDFPEDPDTLEDTDLVETNGTRDSIRIPKVLSSAT